MFTKKREPYFVILRIAAEKRDLTRLLQHIDN
jgi:hypothetical protein